MINVGNCNSDFAMCRETDGQRVAGRQSTTTTTRCTRNGEIFIYNLDRKVGRGGGGGGGGIWNSWGVDTADSIEDDNDNTGGGGGSIASGG